MSDDAALLPRTDARVALRRLRATDLEPFAAYRRDPDVGRWQGWTPLSDEATLAFLQEMAACPLCGRGQWTQLGIARLADDALLGDVGIRVEDDGSEVELGITLSRAAQGRGFAGEALRLALDIAFAATPAGRVIAVTDARNAPCIRLLERGGLRRIGRHATTFRGEPCEEIVYAIARSP